jgi:hypothetical protein
MIAHCPARLCVMVMSWVNTTLGTSQPRVVEP